MVIEGYTKTRNGAERTYRLIGGTDPSKNGRGESGEGPSLRLVPLHAHALIGRYKNLAIEILP